MDNLAFKALDQPADVNIGAPLRLVAELFQSGYPSEISVFDVSPGVDKGTSEQTGLGKEVFAIPFRQATVPVSDLNTRTYFWKRASVRRIAGMPVAQVAH
jgi:hypothetical protein